MTMCGLPLPMVSQSYPVTMHFIDTLTLLVNRLRTTYLFIGVMSCYECIGNYVQSKYTILGLKIYVTVWTNVCVQLVWWLKSQLTLTNFLTMNLYLYEFVTNMFFNRTCTIILRVLTFMKLGLVYLKCACKLGANQRACKLGANQRNGSLDQVPLQRLNHGYIEHEDCNALEEELMEQNSEKMEDDEDNNYQSLFCSLVEEEDMGEDVQANSDSDDDGTYETDNEDVDDTIVTWNKSEVKMADTSLSQLEQLIGEPLEEGDQVFMWDDSMEDGQEIQVNVYKPVHKRVKPVPALFPQEAAVVRRIPEDPLLTLPELSSCPPEFTPTKKITIERMKEMDINEKGFLWPEEEKLFYHVLKLNEQALAFDESERGNFNESYFTPYIIPTVEHIPWVQKNAPVPPGIKDQVIELLKSKIELGVLEHCQSPYRSHWFCIMKKNGKLRIVYNLQELNSITIRDAGLPPILDSFVEPFAGHQCYTVFDMCSGFDARKLHPDSRDLTAISTPLGLLRLTCLPQGFTNSPAEFQKCMLFI